MVRTDNPSAYATRFGLTEPSAPVSTDVVESTNVTVLIPEDQNLVVAQREGDVSAALTDFIDMAGKHPPWPEDRFQVTLEPCRIEEHVFRGPDVLRLW